MIDVVLKNSLIKTMFGTRCFQASCSKKKKKTGEKDEIENSFDKNNDLWILPSNSSSTSAI